MELAPARRIRLFSLLLAVSVAAPACEGGRDSSEAFDYADLEGGGKADGTGVVLWHWRRPANITDQTLAQHARHFDYAQLMNQAVAAGYVNPPWRTADFEGDEMDSEMGSSSGYGDGEGEGGADAEPAADGEIQVGFRWNAGVMTRYATTAGIVSQMDTPAPGPGDLVAIGILALGLGHALISSPSVPQTAECQPCVAPANDPEPDRVDCVPPSQPHWPCAGDHWHDYWWEINQNPQTCECFFNKRSDVICREEIPADPTWAVCG